MEAAIEKLLSPNIDIDEAEAAEAADFAEGSSGSEGEESSEVSSDGEGDEGNEGASGESESEGDDDDDDQADMDADLEEGPSGAIDSSSEDEADEEQDGTKQGFLNGGKADTFARAFARIVDSSAKHGAAPILAGSKSISKRRAEDEEQAKADRAAKRLRLEMKQRGHVVPKRRGEDPLADQREKVLQKTATRGVVRLFNAIAKAQRRLRQTEDATGSKAKAARLGKASFLSELRNSSKAPEGGAGVMSGQRPNAAADAEADDDGAGWEVLQKRFTGLQGGSKMKDWDKAQAEPVGGGEDEAADSDGDSSGDDGW